VSTKTIFLVTKRVYSIRRKMVHLEESVPDPIEYICSLSASLAESTLSFRPYERCHQILYNTTYYGQKVW